MGEDEFLKRVNLVLQLHKIGYGLVAAGVLVLRILNRIQRLLALRLDH